MKWGAYWVVPEVQVVPEGHQNRQNPRCRSTGFHGWTSPKSLAQSPEERNNPE